MSSRAVTVAAVDLGASSGRVMLGSVGADTLRLAEAARFDNVAVRTLGRLHWDVLRIFRGILEGLRAAGRMADGIDAIGIDTWGVDYGLLDRDGRLLGNPVHYRDGRTDRVAERVSELLSPSALYQITGLQYLPFNTLYQLVAAGMTAELEAADVLLLIPDLLSYWLTGVVGAELTIASTTQLLDARSQTWAHHLIERVGIRPGLFPPLRRPGDAAGRLLPDVLADTGLAGPVPVIAVGSHDTASAVAGVPATDEHFAYISCGTWSLVGVELDRPVLTEESRRANFTNEIGIDGTVRYLRNVMGLWLLQECLRTWQAAGVAVELPHLLAEASRLAPRDTLVNADDPAFLAPGDMPQRIVAAARATGQRPPATPAEFVRCILDSLVLAYRSAVHDAQRLTGRPIEVVHLVGGGARNGLLCQLTADALGVGVEAGPVEATALGNVLVQARALGVTRGDRWAIRRLLRATQPTRRYDPTGDARAWAAAADRVPPIPTDT